MAVPYPGTDVRHLAARLRTDHAVLGGAPAARRQPPVAVKQTQATVSPCPAIPPGGHRTSSRWCNTTCTAWCVEDITAEAQLSNPRSAHNGMETQPLHGDRRSSVQSGAYSLLRPGGLGLASLASSPRTTGCCRPLTAALLPASSLRRCPRLPIPARDPGNLTQCSGAAHPPPQQQHVCRLLQ